MNQCYITIFTPTYNRKELLKRLYHSLKEQKNKNFEWIIVDDASSDDTESMVKQWIDNSENNFPICYMKQEHGGKHRALNKGFQMAKGVYFFIVDSDDYLVDDATDKVEAWGREVENQSDIAAVSGLRFTKDKIIGGIPQFKDKDYIDASNLERDKYNLSGDKAEVYKTEIISQYPFPEFEGEYFVTEAVCWDAIAADGYKIRWYNEPIYVCEYLEGGLTKTGANELKGNIENYHGFCYYVSQCLRVKDIWGWSGNLRRYHKVARFLHKSWRERAKDLNIGFRQYLFYLFIVFPYVYTIKGIRKLIGILSRMGHKQKGL